MSVSTLFFRRPRLVALVALTLIAAGLSAFLAIGRQEDPTITNLFATVTTVYPGADPERVESLVSEPLEEALQGVAEIALIESRSAANISIVQLELADTLDDRAIDAAWVDIRAALDEVRTELPAGALDPAFANDAGGTWSAIVALVPEPGSGIDLAATRRHAEALADELRQVVGTDDVELFGAPEEEILVEIDAERLAAMSLTAADVARALGGADAKVGAGRLSGAARDTVVEIRGSFDGVGRIGEVPLVAADGRVARVGDVARVIRGTREPPDELAWSDGRAAVLLGARLDDGLQVDVWMRDVRTVLERLPDTLPDGIGHELVFDQSAYTVERLSDVGTNMAIGVGLVVLVLLVTLGFRAALIVALVLPLVSLAAIATMNLVGLPIHQMSLTGLIVALGLLVDAAIVMTDEIGKRLRAGLPRVEAVGASVKRLFAPLLASTVTTVLSFMPLALLPGAAGDFVGAIAIAVIIMLLWSFAIATTITAALAGWLLPVRDPAGDGRARGNPVSRTVARGFRSVVAFTLANPASAIALSLVLPLTGFASLPTLVQQFFPGVDRNQFHVEVELAEGTSIARTANVALAIGTRLREADGIEQVSLVAGRSAPTFYYNMVGDRDRAPNYAQLLVRTASPAATARLVPTLQQRLADDLPGARVIVRDLVQGPPVAAPVELRLVGHDLDTLVALGERYRDVLSGLDSITMVRASLEPGAPKLVFDVDEAAAREAGLALVDIASSLDAVLDGRVGGSVVDAGTRLPVRVRVDAARRADLEHLLDLPLPIAGGADRGVDTIPLSVVATPVVEPSSGAIVRRDGERINTVQGFIPYGLLPEEALGDVRRALLEVDLPLPPGYRLEFGGDSEERDDTVNDLSASLGIIVTLSIASLVLALGSFRLTAAALVVAGLSAGLSFLALAVFRQPFGINALIGVIGSIGVSINAALILFSGLKGDARARAGDIGAMVDVVTGSGRHIVSTTLTTFGGFLPLILGGGGFWPPFALAIVGGVLLSTVVSFGFVPPVFRLLHRRGALAAPETVERTPPSSRAGAHGTVHA